MRAKVKSPALSLQKERSDKDGAPSGENTRERFIFGWSYTSGLALALVLMRVMVTLRG